MITQCRIFFLHAMIFSTIYGFLKEKMAIDICSSNLPRFLSTFVQLLPKQFHWLFTCRCCLHDLFTYYILSCGRTSKIFAQYFHMWFMVHICVQVLICRNEAEKCLIETSINSVRISMKVLWRSLSGVSMAMSSVLL